MTQQYNAYERELGWDDEIQQDAPEFIVLPEGIYQFTVKEFERIRHTPNPQNPGNCQHAIKLSLQLKSKQHKVRRC